MYGVHPYFMYKHKAGSWVGILYNLAAAQDWWIKNDQTNGLVNLQTVAVGGRVDLYIIMGSNPEQVQSKYLSVIGKPVLIPQWGLGWNQCRYGYRNLDVLKSVLNGYRSNKIPLDVMWSDIDYMKDYRNFIYDDEVAYKGLPDFINSLHS
jgi:alpha-glucosidase (family GH31 glycosyl hydrolase)